jgi:hypothetical protein
MALFENGLESLAEGGALTGVAIGVGVLLLAPGLLPAVARAIRPLAVGAIKVGMTTYDQATSTVRDVTEDLVAEARTELESEGRRAAPARRSKSAQAP